MTLYVNQHDARMTKNAKGYDEGIARAIEMSCDDGMHNDQEQTARYTHSGAFSTVLLTAARMNSAVNGASINGAEPISAELYQL